VRTSPFAVVIPHSRAHSVDSTMCETAVSSKMDFTTQLQSVLVGSVKLSECSLSLALRLDLTTSETLLALPEWRRLVSDHAVLHPRAVSQGKITPACGRPRQVVREAQVQPQRSDTRRRMHSRRRWCVPLFVPRVLI
jgi:hypothetical protein